VHSGILTALFSAAILVTALGGALVPALGLGRTRSEWLALAAGLMLGAAFFHMLPEAFERGGYIAFSLVPVGFLCLFILERYVLAHICEEPPDCAEHRGAKALGWTAFIGLSVHTVFDGVALGSATAEGVGLTAFLAIATHKVPSSVSLASILKSEGLSTAKVLGRVALLASMVPLGAVLYFLLSRALTVHALAPGALAFSAGSFLYVAVSDLLPNATRHSHEGRLRHVTLLTLGLLFTFGLARLVHHMG
jgi:zinc and cadmium transporter